MPRVVGPRTKNRGGTKTYRCQRCTLDDSVIHAGQEYYKWSFRYGGTHYQHVVCGRPRPSQLTQAIFGGLLDMVESAESTISEAETVEDVKEAVEEVKAEAESLRDQYEEASEAFQGGGPNAEKKDQAEEFYEILDGFDPDEDEEFDEDEARLTAEKEYIWKEVPSHMWDERGWSEASDLPDDIIERGRIVQELEIDNGSDMDDFITARLAELAEESQQGLESAKSEALDLLGQCPF